VKAIDLSGDFRLREQSVFEKHYKQPHTAMNAQAEFVYGLTETNRTAIKQARLIANPGCFATATLLGLAPLVANNLIAGRTVVDAKTGSSGSGAKAAANTHHPQRMNRAGTRSYRRLDQRTCLHDPFVAGCARHLCVDLCRSKERA
jgi:N-acetyl-gamma-glutamyl-phosphate reductase